MMDEYHTKYKRNIIIKFKDGFFEKMSILPDGRYVPDGTYLCADVMPMIYIESFDEFINEYICKSQILTEVAKNTFDYGAFLKDRNYWYEHETRIKLHMHIDNDYNFQYLSREFYLKHFFVSDEEKIVNDSMIYIQNCKKTLDKGFEEVLDRIKEIGGKQSFELCLNELEINEIVDGILLHENATESEKNEVYKLARLRNVQVEEIDFDKVCAPQASV